MLSGCEKKENRYLKRIFFLHQRIALLLRGRERRGRKRPPNSEREAARRRGRKDVSVSARGVGDRATEKAERGKRKKRIFAGLCVL